MAQDGRFPAWEVAELIVSGRVFRDWETVQVHRDMETLATTFMFTATETTPRANVVTSMQIMPGDACTIILAGQIALSGFVNVRQASYDKDRHGVMIQGRGKTQDAIDTSIELDKIGGGQFKDKTISQIANTVLAPVGIGFTVINGGPDAEKPFKSEQVHPGESPHAMISRLAQERGLRLGEDASGGDMVAIGGPTGGGGSLVEGGNIKEARVTLSDITLTKPNIGLGQGTGSNEEFGSAVSEMKVEAGGSATRHRPLVIVAENVATKDDLRARLAYEIQWREATSIEAVITVYGWLNGGTSGALWREGTEVEVNTAMGMVQRPLWLKSVTFTQDSGAGTQTILELVKVPFQSGIATPGGSGGDTPTPNDTAEQAFPTTPRTDPTISPLNSQH